MESGGKKIGLEEAKCFRLEVLKEIERERQMLAKVNKPRKGFTIGWAVAFIILGLAVAILFQNPVGFLFWVLIAFILYGFNFLIWFIPTTRKGEGEEKAKLKVSGETFKGPILYLIKKKKGLGAEIAITMFLSGMVPLALSFFVLFGIGIVLGVYFGLIGSLYDHDMTLGLIFQMIVILVFFIILVILKPQERGFAQTARRIKDDFASARRKGKVALIFIIAIIGLFVAVLGLLFAGAILAPGGTWKEILSTLGINGYYNSLVLLLVFITELILMRHFQAVSGRRMANKLLNDRIQKLKKNSLEPIEAAISHAEGANASSISRNVLENAKTSFYSVVIYDLYEHNLFGYSPQK